MLLKQCCLLLIFYQLLAFDIAHERLLNCEKKQVNMSRSWQLGMAVNPFTPKGFPIEK